MTSRTEPRRLPRGRRRLLAVACCSLVFLGACGGGDSDGDPAGTPTTEVSSTPDPGAGSGGGEGSEGSEGGGGGSQSTGLDRTAEALTRTLGDAEVTVEGGTLVIRLTGPAGGSRGLVACTAAGAVLSDGEPFQVFDADGSEVTC